MDCIALASFAHPHRLSPISSEDEHMNPKRSAVLGAIGAVAIVFVVWQPSAADDKAKADPAPTIPGAKDVAEIRCIGNGIFPEGPFDGTTRRQLNFS
jgi:hypothetical protein